MNVISEKSLYYWTNSEGKNIKAVPLETSKEREYVILDETGKAPQCLARSDNFEQITSVSTLNDSTRLFFELPVMEAGLGYTFWIRLIVPCDDKDSQEIVVSVSTPRFQHMVSSQEKFRICESNISEM